MSGTAYRVATYNIHGCVGSDGRYAPERIARVIGEIGGLDVIGLQEVDTRRPSYEGLHQLDYLERHCALAAVSGPNIRAERGHYGNALLARWPIRAVRRHDISYGRREPRGVLDVDVAAPDGPLRVLVTHFGLAPDERHWQAHRLHALLAPPLHGRTLLLGDFNDWLPYGSAGIKALATSFAAGYAARSFPARLRLLKLDRIYAHPRPREAIATAHATPLARSASDHVPIVARLRWDRPAPVPGAAAGELQRSLP